MKGIIKYKGRFYKKSNKSLKDGDLVKLQCSKDSKYFKYNGIYNVNKFNEILVSIKEEDSEEFPGGRFLCIKLGYNVLKYGSIRNKFKHQYYKLVEVERKKYLPTLINEEDFLEI